jgi:hypothetical protein
MTAPLGNNETRTLSKTEHRRNTQQAADADGRDHVTLAHSPSLRHRSATLHTNQQPTWAMQHGTQQQALINKTVEWCGVVIGMAWPDAAPTYKRTYKR